MEKNDIEINVPKWRSITNAILLHIEKDLRINDVSLDEDYYWAVAPEEFYEFRIAPTNLNVGSLCDDLEFLFPVERDERMAVSRMLLHVAPLLRYLATKIGQ
jgi:hypothetical protein